MSKLVYKPFEFEGISVGKVYTGMCMINLCTTEADDAEFFCFVQAMQCDPYL